MADEPQPAKPPTRWQCFKASIAKCCSSEWFNSLGKIGKLRLLGVILSCMATCLSIITITTEFWVKQYIRGVIVHRGLWRMCSFGHCTRLTNVPLYIILSIIFMMISVVTAYGSVISGTLSLTPLAAPKELSWPKQTIAFCSISGFTGGMGLFNFMRYATREPNAFLAWSLGPGWLSVFVVSLAGTCHFVAKRQEREMIAGAFRASIAMHTLEEEVAATSGHSKVKKELPPSSL